MKRLWTHLLTLTVMAAGAAVRGADESSPDGPESKPGRQADVQTMQAWCDRYVEAVKTGDLDAYRTFWSHVIWLPPGEPLLQGIEACMEHHRPALRAVETGRVHLGAGGDVVWCRRDRACRLHVCGNTQAGFETQTRTRSEQGFVHCAAHRQRRMDCNALRLELQQQTE